MSAKSKGTSRERAVKLRYEKAGYCCTRASMSLGEWDLVCTKPDDLVFIQVKTRDFPFGVEAEEISRFVEQKMFKSARFICERYRPGKGWDIREYDKTASK